MLNVAIGMNKQEPHPEKAENSRILFAFDSTVRT